MEYSWEEPLCLIENSDDKGLQINEMTLRKLSKVKVPVSVVAIVGPYRTGKSYLMNSLAGGQKGENIIKIKSDCINTKITVSKGCILLRTAHIV